MTYDINGNLLAATDANGNNTPTAGDGTATYGYDRANRLTSINYSDATPDLTFVLDNAGNRTSMTDGSGPRPVVTTSWNASPRSPGRGARLATSTT